MGFFNDPTAYVVGYDDGRGVKIPAKEFGSGGVTSWNDLTDKPFGEVIEREDVVLVSDYNGAWARDSKGTGYTFCKASGQCEENAEIKAEVIVNGKKYSVSGKSKHKNIWSGAVGQIYYDYIGNPALADIIGDDTDTGDDYCAFFENANGEDGETSFYFYCLDGGAGMGEVTVVQAGMVKATVKTVTIDPKYLPKSEAVADVTAAPTANEFNALLAALRNAGYLEQ